MSDTSALAPLKHRPFRFLAAGRVVTMFGNAMAPIALAFAVLDLTGSVRDLGLVVGARSVTTVVFLLVGGVVADRLPRHRVMVVSSLLACASQAMVAALVLTGSATIAALVGLAVVNGTVSAFAFPAASALMGQTVPGEIRKQANALARLGVNGAMIVGASVGGLLVAGLGSGAGLAVDAATFGIAGLLFGLVRVPDYRDQRTSRTGTWQELREGWREFTSHTWVWVVVLGFCFFNMALAGGLQVLGPAIADQTFGRTAWGLILAAETAGMVAGALIAVRLRVRRLLRLGVLCCAGMAVVLAALALAPYAVVLVALSFLAGMGLEQFGIAWETSMQEHIPADTLARVYAYDALGSFLAMPIGQVAVGPVAEVTGQRNALLIAAGVAGLAVVGMMLSRSVRSLAHLPARSAEVDSTIGQAQPVS